MGVVTPGSLAADLRALAQSCGLDAIGFARAEPFLETRRHLEERKAAGLHGGMHFTYGNPARSTDPAASLPGARTIVVGARGYRRPAPARPSGTPARVARYSWRDHYAPLRASLEVIAARLRDGGWAAKVLVDDNALVDREAAYRAGIGWYGKNANLLLPGHGSWFVLGSVLTDASLPETPRQRDGCGSCSRCLPACPTEAIVAPGVIDARRCLAWLLEAPGTFPREHRAALGDRIYGCDDCQEACPPNRLVDRRATPAAPDVDDEAYVDVVEMLGLSDDDLLARFGRWYVPKRQARYLRRNALIVLGNVGDGSDPRVERVLRDALAHDDGVVRSHAAWSCIALDREDLLVLLDGDDDPDVLSELRAAGVA